MIIRSQDKKSIIADLNLNIRHEESWADDFWDIETSTEELVGTYSTEEKAIKVLDMICETYGKMKRNSNIMNGSIKELCLLPTKGQDIALENFKNIHVFQMPEDSEV